ncbi:hypothetical protein, partial [Halalkalibacter akibai]|uniref:hypothetical protein n=1 Tax=Halalkalibacter akibai TaxID=1411 RepID=UPI00054FD203
MNKSLILGFLLLLLLLMISFTLQDFRVLINIGIVFGTFSLLIIAIASGVLQQRSIPIENIPYEDKRMNINKLALNLGLSSLPCLIAAV